MQSNIEKLTSMVSSLKRSEVTDKRTCKLVFGLACAIVANVTPEKGVINDGTILKSLTSLNTKLINGTFGTSIDASMIKINQRIAPKISTTSKIYGAPLNAGSYHIPSDLGLFITFADELISNPTTREAIILSCVEDQLSRILTLTLSFFDNWEALRSRAGIS